MKLFRPVLMGLLIALLVGCGSRQDNPQLNFKLVEKPANQEVGLGGEEPPLHVAIASINSLERTIVYYGELLRYLESKVNRPVQITQRKTYLEVNDLIKRGKIDLAFVCTFAYVAGHDDFGMELLVAPRVKGKSTYQSYIVVRRDSGIEDFAMLRRKVFAFTDPLSTTGRLYPLFMVKSLGEAEERFFAKSLYTYSHDNAIRALKQNLVDGIGINNLVFDDLTEQDSQLAAELRVIKKSEPFGIPPMVVRPDLSPELKEQLRAIFLGMQDDAEGRDILHKLGIDQFTPIDDAAYDSVRMLEKETNRR